jgi:hypothetical protein
MFFRNDVAGLAEATTVLENDGPAGRWLLCLQWADGRREMVRLPQWLDLPTGPRLWLSPTPHPPRVGTIPGWSAAGRHRWLAGETPDTAALFNEIVETINRFVVFPDEGMPGASATVALWIMLTYCYPVWPAVPYLHVTGPLASGKSRLLDVLSRLVWRPTLASSMTAGVLFRTLHERGGTLLLDEAEHLSEKTAQMSEMRTVLLAGYRAGSPVSRLQKSNGGYRSVVFDVFGPKALVSIGELPPTLASRCIRIGMFRTAGDRPQVRALLNSESDRWQTLRDNLHAFALTRASEILLAANRPDNLVTGMSGRDGELWRPVLTPAALCQQAGVADLVGPVRAFADQIINENADDTSPDPDKTLVALLAEAVNAGQTDLTPKDLLDRVQKDDGVTFARWTPHRVAHTLKRYGLTTYKTSRGRRSYCQISRDQLRRVATAYGLCIPVENASFATDATAQPAGPPTKVI